MDETPETTQSISAAAQAYQLAMNQQAAPQMPAPLPSESSHDPSRDVVMNDIGSESVVSPPPVATGSAPATIPIPPRTGTPARIANGVDVPLSRSASQHPEPSVAMPTEAPPHGAPARQYLNGKVTASLLEGMKQLAKDQPKDPLRVLGEFLLQRSKELEGT